MNKDKVMAMVRKKSAESGASINTLLLMYFFERFLARLAKSEYNSDLILKGGFLLSSLMGIGTRTTMDMDMSLRNQILNEATIQKIFEQIASVSVEDDISYEIKDIREIKIEDEYPGYRVALIGHLSNIRQPFSVDVATGDPVTPSAMRYRYHSVFPDMEDITLVSYSLETIIAEKLETIVSRKTDNSRSKDFYDLHLIWNLKGDQIDRSRLAQAIRKTFEYRGTEYDTEKLIAELEEIRGDEGFRTRWKLYCERNSYVEAVSFDVILDELEEKVRLLG